MSLTAKEKIKLLLKEKSLNRAEITPYDICPTRVPELNKLISGGFPKGKACLLFGARSSGKSTIAIEAIADEMKKDKEHVTLLIPAEKGEDMQYYSNLGLDIERTVLMEKEIYILEESMLIAINMMRDGLVNSVLVDSWDGLVGFKEVYRPTGVEKEITKEAPGAKAYAGDKIWKRMKAIIASKNVLFLIICQMRVHGLGGMFPTLNFSGGNALSHYTDLAIAVSAGKLIKETVDGHEIAVGQEVNFKIDKTKINSNAHKRTMSRYMFDSQWDQLDGIWNFAMQTGVIDKSGGWYTYPGFPVNKSGKCLMQGEATCKSFFNDTKSNRDALEEIVKHLENNTSCTKEDIDKLTLTTIKKHEPKKTTTEEAAF